MLEMRAIVLSTSGDEAEVSPLGGGGCGHCDSANGCGSGKLSKMFCSSDVRKFVVRNQIDAQVGDEVNVTLPDGVLLRSSWRMYGLPLILMLGGGLLAASFAGSVASRDGMAVLGSVLGLVIGFALGRLPSSGGSTMAIAQSIVAPGPRS